MMEKRARGPRSLRHNGSHCPAGVSRADVELGPGAKRSQQPWTRTQVPGPEPWTGEPAGGGGGGGLQRILLTQSFCRSVSVETASAHVFCLPSGRIRLVFLQHDQQT